MKRDLIVLYFRNIKVNLYPVSKYTCTWQSCALDTKLDQVNHTCTEYVVYKSKASNMYTPPRFTPYVKSNKSAHCKGKHATTKIQTGSQV